MKCVIFASLFSADSGTENTLHTFNNSLALFSFCIQALVEMEQLMGMRCFSKNYAFGTALLLNLNQFTF